MAAIFAAAGAGTGNVPLKDLKDWACAGNDPENPQEALEKLCSYCHGQEAAASFNIITTIACAACAVVLGLTLCITILQKVAKWPIKIANIVCAVFELIALIVLPVLFNKMVGSNEFF